MTPNDAQMGQIAISLTLIETHLKNIAHALNAIAAKQDPEYRTVGQVERGRTV